MSERQRVHVCFETWSGRHVIPAVLIGVTPARYRVRWLEDFQRRRRGDVGLVPKYAVMPMYGESLPDGGQVKADKP